MTNLTTRLTTAQEHVLKRAASASGRASTYWLSGGTIDTKVAYRACRQLQAKGLLSRDPHGYWPLWSITDAGRSALAVAVS